MEINNERDIQNLIDNEIEENTNLEYKAPLALNNKGEIVKDISAMANSDGGTILYGLCEDNETKKPVRIDWLEEPDQKERIEQIIQTNITPKLDVRIQEIPKDSETNKFVLKVEIPKSDAAPHQDHYDRKERRYWRRNGFTTRQLEHYEVEDLFFKRKRPVLQIGLINISESRDEPAYEIYLENIGKVVGEKAYIKLLIPSECHIDGWRKTKEYIQGYSSYENVLNEALVYPGLRQGIGIIYHPKKFELGDLRINFVMVCKDMEVLEGEIYINMEREMRVKYEKSNSYPRIRNVMEYTFKDRDY